MNVFERLESFINELEMESYEVGAGLKDEANFSAIFERVGGLISHETVEEIKASDVAPGERAEYLSFLLCMIVDNAMKELTDEELTVDLSAEAEIEGKSVPYRQLPVLIANEQSHAARERLDAARRRIVAARINPIAKKIVAGSHDIAAGLGYNNYADFFEKLEGISLGALRSETDRLMRETESFYLNELDFYAETVLKLPADELAQYDFAYMRRADRFDPLFPAGSMLDAVWTTMRSLGIEAEHHPNVRLDIEKRDKKSPRAFCCAVRVPREVYLVIMPHGGVDDYSSFLHELGHTLHYAHTDAALPVAARYLGDNSVTEAHAGTLEHLIFNRRWLRDRLDVRDPDEYLRFMNFFELYMLRRYSGKLQYEIALHGGRRKIDDCAELYAKILTGATRVRYFPDSFLQDVDSHFYCARYLRAWMLERQIREALETKFGEDWFANRGAGALLKELWSQGQKFRAEAVSAALGFKSLDFSSIINDYRS
jgi:hypothetical protein